MVLAAGDFNTNFALAGQGKADEAGAFDTFTDTPQEVRSRYDYRAIGNIADPANKAAVDELNATMTNFWTAENRTVLVDGQLMTPEQAQAELKSGKVDRKSERYQQLVKAMDGLTHLSAHKRFDNILSSRNARIESAHIDQTAKGSDHQPLMAEVRWD